MNFLLFTSIFLLVTKLNWITVQSYNLQTKLPIILKPLINEIDLEHPINFGVSLTTLTNKQNLNKTILLAAAPAADLGDFNERPGK